MFRWVQHLVSVIWYFILFYFILFHFFSVEKQTFFCAKEESQNIIQHQLFVTDVWCMMRANVFIFYKIVFIIISKTFWMWWKKEGKLLCWSAWSCILWIPFLFYFHIKYVFVLFFVKLKRNIYVFIAASVSFISTGKCRSREIFIMIFNCWKRSWFISSDKPRQ